MRTVKENKWLLLGVAVLTVLAIAISVILLYRPRREPPPPEATRAVETAASVPLPTLTPEPAPTTPPPVITPPAASAASGSDVILNHVPRASDSDLEADPGPELETGE